SDGALWWVSYGSLEAEAFPLVRAGESEGRPVRYRRAALVGAVNAATGDTRLYLAPGADSLAAAWAAVLAPLIQPLDSLPAGLRGQLPFPNRVFRAATTLVRRQRSDTSEWAARPREPFELIAPAPPAPPGPLAEGRGGAAGLRPWTAQGVGAGRTPAGLVAAAGPGRRPAGAAGARRRRGLRCGYGARGAVAAGAQPRGAGRRGPGRGRPRDVRPRLRPAERAARHRASKACSGPGPSLVPFQPLRPGGGSANGLHNRLERH